MILFSGSTNRSLSEKISKEAKIPLGKLEIFKFPDGETRIRVLDDVLDEDTWVLQSRGDNPDSSYMELFFIVDALKRSGAKSVSCIIPYLSYQRQDHIFREGEAVSMDVIVKTLESTGVERIITFDLHTIKIPELFNIPITHLSALPLFADK
ncbi:MAG: ribose-phosphate diphosphokinase, partial [Patescibacteria group bacterium]